ncbi:hypothetical protein SBRCBS47491_009676 [Sporothrix bragantina]|uniref:Xylanolytic transcriptional activator regulatory domain-containing protein n=1 Tax=Sporothrix bragantina TaxID=671064 RepID=A0ABP0CZ64_9PEZI
MATECNFSVSELERSHAVDYRPHARRQQARQRVARLEGLVTEMRDQMQSLPGPMALSSIPARSPAVGTTTNDDMGKLSLTDDHVVYTGSSHWVTILEDIQRLKDELSDGQGMDSTKPDPEPSIATESPYADTFAFEPPAIKISLLNSGPITNMDGTVSSWVLMGVIVRLALRMGLHRDPRHFLSFRPLEAEMRRRLWISLYQMDFFTSVQLGLARIIKDAHFLCLLIL